VTWLKALLYGAVVTPSVFLFVNWKGCWLYEHNLRDLTVFTYVFAWVVLFCVVRVQWRVILTAITVLGLIPAIGLHGPYERHAAAESATVEALRKMHSSLGIFREQHPDQGYPSQLPKVDLSQLAQKYYQYKYLSIRSAEGKTNNYTIESTPTRRTCDFYYSFTLADDGRIFYTAEPRAATSSDRVVE
jgi:hypothetical protein